MTISLFLNRTIFGGTYKLQTPYAKKMKKRRQSTVEPVLGTLINFMGIRRIWTRGIKSANKFMIAAAIAYNLKKWLNYKQTRTRTAVMALQKQLRAAVLHFLATVSPLQHYTAKTVL